MLSYPDRDQTADGSECPRAEAVLLPAKLPFQGAPPCVFTCQDGRRYLVKSEPWETKTEGKTRKRQFTENRLSASSLVPYNLNTVLSE